MKKIENKNRKIKKVKRYSKMGKSKTKKYRYV